MSCKQKAKDLFLKFDIFATSEFLRYDSEPEYRTMTGAFCSIVTIVTFFVIFTNVIVDTFGKKQVIWSSNTVEEQVDSFELDIKVKGQNKFMFGVLIGGANLSDDVQYFDVNLTLKTRTNSIQTQRLSFKIQRCTPDHWNVNSQFLSTYYRLNFSKMYCPPLGSKIPIEGKYTSETFKYAEIQLLKCTNTSSRPCANESAYQNRTFLMSFFFLNTLINPQLPEYVSYYLQDRNYVQFTTEYTSLLNLFVSKFKITTDQTILPYQSPKQQIGSIVNSLAQIVPRQQAEGIVFANAILRRASTSVIVNRSFKKLDQTLSYIGGLFGFVMVFLLLMNQYTEYSFQIDASSHLYHQDKQSPIDSDKFNFLVFISYLFYLFLGIFGIEPNWKIMKTFDDSREQIQKQFDIRFLFERMNFIQKSLRLLYNEEETNFIHLKRKPTLKQASQLRQNYKFKENFQENNLQMTQNNLNNEGNQGPKSSNSKVMPVDKNMSASVKMKKGLKMLKKKSERNVSVSKKIIQDIDPHIIKIIHQSQVDNQGHSESQQNSLQKLQSKLSPHPNNIQTITQSLYNYAEDSYQRSNQAQMKFMGKIQEENNKKIQEMDFEFMN